MCEILILLGYLTFALQISKSDITFRIIRNRDLALFSVFSILSNLNSLRADLLLNIGLATFVLLLMHIIFKGRIGPGDLKLFWVMTAWAPLFLDWLVFFAWAWILGGLFSIASSLKSRRVEGSIPFAPFIFLAFLASI